MGLDIYLTRELYIGGNYSQNLVKCEISKGEVPIEVNPRELISLNILAVPYLFKTHSEYELDSIITNHMSSSNDEVTVCTLSVDNLKHVKEDIDKFIANPTEDTLTDLGVELYHDTNLKHLLEVFIKVSNEIETELERNKEFSNYTYKRSY